MSEEGQRGASNAAVVRVGCSGLPPNISRREIFAAVAVLEEHGLTREPAPSVKALRRWRREAPEHAGFALVAPPAIFETDAALEPLRAAVAALEPEVLLLRPPVTLGPSQSGRDRLRELVSADLCAAGTVVFWPAGLWDSEVTRSLADELDLVALINPLATDPQDRDRALWERELERGTAYLRLERVANRRRFDDYELDEIAELVVELERAWVIFAHHEALRDAHALAQKL